MTNIIELVNTHSSRCNLTYDKLWAIMKRPGCFDPVEAQAGLCVEDMIPVFEHFDRRVKVYDANNVMVYSRERSPARRCNHVRPETWKFLVTEHHVYVLNRRSSRHFHLNKNVGYEEVNHILSHPYERISPLYPTC